MKFVWGGGVEGKERCNLCGGRVVGRVMVMGGVKKVYFRCGLG